MAGLFFITLYSAFILYVTLFPFHFPPLKTVLHDITNIQYNLTLLLNFSAEKTDIFANFVLFVILGILFGIFMTKKSSKPKTVLGIGAGFLYSFILSAFIEILQKYIPERVQSIGDVIIDTVSGTAGALAVVFIKISGAGDIIKERARRMFRENPLKLFWIIYISVIFTGALYPFYFKPDISSILHELNRIDHRSLLHGAHITFKFFSRGIIYFTMGALCVIASLKERGRLFLHISAKGCLCAAFIFFSEAAQIFTPYHIPSRIDIETHLFWLVLGITIFAVPALRTEKARINKDVPDGGRKTALLWISSAAVLLFIFIEGLRPFAFSLSRQWIKHRLAAIEWIPFSSYINNFNMPVPEDAVTKWILYILLGFVTGFTLKRQFPPLMFVPVFCTALCIFVSAAIETAQILIPSRVPSVTDIIIAAAGGAAGSFILNIILRAAGRKTGTKRPAAG